MGALLFSDGLEVDKTKIALSPFTDDRAISFFQSEFQQQIRLDFKDSCNVEQQLQRNTAIHSWRFDRCKVLAADVKHFRKLLLGKPLCLSVISDGVGEVFHALGVVKIVFHNKLPTFIDSLPKIGTKQNIATS